MEKIKIQLNQDYYLDLGSIPVKVKIISIKENEILCKYLHSWPGRTELLSYDLFKMNGYEI